MGELHKAYECGLVANYTMDVGWQRSYTVYTVYGKSGGSKEAITTTEALCQGCRRDGEQSINGPMMWVGDFNATPCELGTVRELMKEDQWADVGHRAHW